MSEKRKKIHIYTHILKNESQAKKGERKNSVQESKKDEPGGRGGRKNTTRKKL